jgi:hypothetical protein
VATDFLLDQSYPLRKQWYSLYEVTDEAFVESRSWRFSFFDEEVVLLNLWKVVMNLLLEGLDPFNQFFFMICQSVGGIFQ